MVACSWLLTTALRGAGAGVGSLVCIGGVLIAGFSAWGVGLGVMVVGFGVDGVLAGFHMKFFFPFGFPGSQRASGT
jgi:hypothetical protein